MFQVNSLKINDTLFSGEGTNRDEIESLFGEDKEIQNALRYLRRPTSDDAGTIDIEIDTASQTADVRLVPKDGDESFETRISISPLGENMTFAFAMNTLEVYQSAQKLASERVVSKFESDWNAARYNLTLAFHRLFCSHDITIDGDDLESLSALTAQYYNKNRIPALRAEASSDAQAGVVL